MLIAAEKADFERANVTVNLTAMVRSLPAHERGCPMSIHSLPTLPADFDYATALSQCATEIEATLTDDLPLTVTCDHEIAADDALVTEVCTDCGQRKPYVATSFFTLPPLVNTYRACCSTTFTARSVEETWAMHSRYHNHQYGRGLRDFRIDDIEAPVVESMTFIYYMAMILRELDNRDCSVALEAIGPEKAGQDIAAWYRNGIDVLTVTEWLISAAYMD